MDPFGFGQFKQQFEQEQQQQQVPPRVLMSSKKAGIIALLVTIIVAAVTFYVYLPAINVRSSASAYYIAFLFGVYVVVSFFLSGKFSSASKAAAMGGIFLVVAVNVLSFFSSPLFRADEYREQITMNESVDFSEDFEAIALDKIPVIDYAVAKQLGDKKMGQITGLGSQYSVSDQYTLVSVNDNLYRVSPLEYRDFFKWFQNRGRGIPGYIKVNVNDPSDVELVELEEGLKYAPSGYFHQKLERHVRFAYPNDLLTDYSFELDDSGKPYWVISSYMPEIGFYGGNDAQAVIILDPVTGEMEKYAINDVPSWVDRVQPTNIALEQINNWGLYINGFWNTFFGQKDMLVTTEGHNYVLIDNQMHLYTGLTSVGADNSIVGFALINLKTKDASFYKIGGADESSAMESAQGQVQHLGYQATFPILLNVNNEPSYFVSLKDQAQLVKKFAFVSVKNYQIVGIGDTVAEAQLDYLKQLKQNGVVTDVPNNDVMETVSGVLTSFTTAIQDGNSNYYFTIEGDDRLFIAPIAISNELVLSASGQEVSVTIVASEDKTVLVESFDNLNLDY
ncbi:MAG: CvpA family protein [Erysipelotrichaceae bacterium]